MDCKAEPLRVFRAVTFGNCFLFIVRAELNALVCHLFNFEASMDLLQLPDDVWEG